MKQHGRPLPGGSLSNFPESFSWVVYPGDLTGGITQQGNKSCRGSSAVDESEKRDRAPVKQNDLSDIPRFSPSFNTRSES